MTVEADIFNVLSPLVGGRAFPDYAPATTAQPFITFQQLGGGVVGFLDNAIPSKKNGLFQVNVWASTRAQAASLALAIESAMHAATTMQASAQNAPASDYDPDLPAYGSRLDFSIWSDR